MLEEKHILYVIDQSDQTRTEGCLVSLVFSGQEDAGTRVACVVTLWVSGALLRHGEYLPKKCVFKKNHNKNTYWSFWDCFWTLYLCVLGRWGAKGNIVSSWENETYSLVLQLLVCTCILGGEQTKQSVCPARLVSVPKQTVGFLHMKSMQEFIMWPSILFVCIHNLQFIKEILAVALCLWEWCRDENCLSDCKRFHTKPPAWKDLSLVRERSLTLHKSSAVLTGCLEMCIISKLIMFSNTP